MLNTDESLRPSERSAWWGLVANAILTATKVVVGVTGQSPALVADGIHSAADTLSSIAIIVGLTVSRQPPDLDHNYGHAKAEAISQKVVAFILALVGFQLGSSSIHQLWLRSVTRPSNLALFVACGVTVLKFWMFRQQRRTALTTGSHALMASAEDNRVDVISGGVAALGIFGSRWLWRPLDNIAALIIAGLVVWLGIQLFAGAARDLMDKAASPEDILRIRQCIGDLPEGLRVIDLKTRLVASQIWVDIEVGASPDLRLFEADRISNHLSRKLTRLPDVGQINVRVVADQPEVGSSASS